MHAALAPLALLLVVAPLCARAAGDSADVERFRQLFNRGRRALERGHYDLAVEAFVGAERLDPRSARIHAYLGRAYYRLHRYRRAEKSFRRALSLGPGDPEARLLLAQVLREQIRFDEALAEFDAVAQKDPSKYEPFYYAGQILYQRGDYERALSHLKRAATLAPGSPLARYQLGLAYLRLEDLAAAEREVRRALEIDPGYTRALYTLAGLRERAGKTAEAETLRARFDEIQRRQIEQREDQARVKHYERQGLLYLEDNEPAKAVEEFRTAIELKPEEASLHTFLGIALSYGDSTAETVAAFKEAIRLDPEQASALTELGRLHAMAGKFEPARGYLERAISAKPGLIEAHEFLANVYEDLGRPEEALRQRRIMQELRSSGKGESIYD